jgi:hypothetical protein
MNGDLAAPTGEVWVCDGNTSQYWMTILIRIADAPGMVGTLTLSLHCSISFINECIGEMDMMVLMDKT